MRKQQSVSLKRWLATTDLIVVGAILFGVSAAASNAGQKPSRSASSGRESRAIELGSVDQLKEVFQNDAGKVRLVALVSPT